MRRIAVILAAALPVAGTLFGIALREAEWRDASEWRIPVTGVDPADPLRGRYIAFSYTWQARGDPALCRAAAGCRLCLENGGAAAAIVPAGSRCAAPVDPAASGLTITRRWDGPPGQIVAAARLWVPEARAAILDRQLRGTAMVMVARLTPQRRLIAERLEPAAVRR